MSKKVVENENTEIVKEETAVENTVENLNENVVEGAANVVLEDEEEEDVVESEGVTEPEATVPEATVPEATVPEATVPEATEPEATVPEATEPEATAPEAIAPEATEPETTEPETTEPEVKDIGQELAQTMQAKAAQPRDNRKDLMQNVYDSNMQAIKDGIENNVMDSGTLDEKRDFMENVMSANLYGKQLASAENPVMVPDISVDANTNKISLTLTEYTPPTISYELGSMDSKDMESVMQDNMSKSEMNVQQSMSSLNSYVNEKQNGTQVDGVSDRKNMVFYAFKQASEKAKENANTGMDIGMDSLKVDDTVKAKQSSNVSKGAKFGAIAGAGLGSIVPGAGTIAGVGAGAALGAGIGKGLDVVMSNEKVQTVVDAVKTAGVGIAKSAVAGVGVMKDALVGDNTPKSAVKTASVESALKNNAGQSMVNGMSIGAKIGSVTPAPSPIAAGLGAGAGLAVSKMVESRQNLSASNKTVENVIAADKASVRQDRIAQAEALSSNVASSEKSSEAEFI